MVNKTLRHLAAVAMIPAAAGLVVLIQHHFDRIAPKPNPPRFADVNSDGIDDKIMQVRVGVPLGPFGAYLSLPQLTEMVLYGTVVNGETIYVPKHVYDDLMYLKSKES